MNCETCGFELTPEEIEGNFQEHDCNEILREQAQDRRLSFLEAMD